MATAIDYINGDTMCECTGSGGNSFINLSTGEVQCAIVCSEEPLCRKAVSYQDGQLNLVCDEPG